MPRTAIAGRGCVCAIAGVALLIVLVPWQCIIWDGGFPPIECRLQFVDSDGKPVPGVTLTVLTKAGGVCRFYPVDEFVPERPVVSDTEGKMVFHHSRNILEFAGHEYSNLLGMRFGETDAPHYDCVFSLDGREVFRTPYNFHHSEWEAFQQPGAKRSWKSPWNLAKYGPLPNEDVHQWRMRLFDTNGDGKLDREESTAAHWFMWQLDREEGAENQLEQTGPVIERVIVISTR